MNFYTNKKIAVGAAMVAVLVPFFAFAYVNPGSPKGAVNDFAEMLSPAQVQALELKLDNFNKNTGNALVVAIVNNLGGDTVENFAVQLFKDWGLGQKGKDNGVLILVSKEDKKIKIEVGYGLEGDLTDAQSYWIIQDVITPAFKNGDYAGGLNGAADKIIGAISGGEVIPSEDISSGSSNSGRGFDWFFLIFFVPIWLASILGRSKSWWAGGVLGGVAGVIIGLIKGFLYFGIISIALLIPIGLVFDYFVSKNYA
ncbi:MAG: TPM domain-containing protein, partial [Minisyncoccia bacterium]